MRPDPPALAVWLLTRRLSAEWRDFVLGDLEEEFHARAAASRGSARRWFWWQTIRCLVAPLPHVAPPTSHLAPRTRTSHLLETP